MVILACGRSSNYSLSLVMPLDRSFLGQLAMFDIFYLCFYFLGTFFFDHDLMLRSMITNYDYKAQCSSDSSMILRFFFCVVLSQGFQGKVLASEIMSTFILYTLALCFRGLLL